MRLCSRARLPHAACGPNCCGSCTNASRTATWSSTGARWQRTNWRDWWASRQRSARSCWPNWRETACCHATMKGRSTAVAWCATRRYAMPGRQAGRRVPSTATRVPNTASKGGDRGRGRGVLKPPLPMPKNPPLLLHLQLRQISLTRDPPLWPPPSHRLPRRSEVAGCPRAGRFPTTGERGRRPSGRGWTSTGRRRISATTGTPGPVRRA